MTTPLTVEELNASPLHVLAAIALEDLEACEKLPDVEIDMSSYVYSWHGVCYVCVAGAVLHQRFGVTHTGRQVPRFATAIDYLRRGRVSAALSKFGRPITVNYDRRMRHYHNEPEGFKTAFRKLILDLKEAGI